MNDVPSRSAFDPLLAARLGLDRKAGRRKYWLWVVAAALFVCITGGIFWLRGGQVHNYVVTPVVRGALVVTVSATGTLEPRDQVDVGAEVSGRIDRIDVDFNDHVRKGEVLARINTDQYAAQLEQAKATLEQAEATLAQARQTNERYTALARHNAISRELLTTSTGDLGRAIAGVALARAQVNQDKTLVAYCTIYSPIDGVVLDRKVSAGQTVAASFQTPVLFTLASDLRQMELDVNIDEADVGAVRPGAMATFSVDAYPARKFAARLVAVHNAAKTVQNVVTYEGVLDEEDSGGLLRPGMTATAEIRASTVRNALLVSNAALRFTPPEDLKNGTPPDPPQLNGVNMARVWTVYGTTLKPHDLRLGATDGRQTLIIAGDLRPGEQVVTDIADKPR